MADIQPKGRSGAAEASAGGAPAAPPIEGVLVARVPAARLEPFLARAALFQGFEGESIARIAPLFVPLEVRAGTELLRAGVRADGMGIVFSGEVVVKGADAEIERLGPGESFGEAAILGDGTSPYTVVAEDPCRVLWIGGDLAGLPFVGALFVRWARDDERHAKEIDARLDDEAASGEAPRSGLWWENDPVLTQRFKRP